MDSPVSSEPQRILRNRRQHRSIPLGHTSLTGPSHRNPAVSIRDLQTFEGRPLAHPDEPIFDQGLAFDLETVMARRQLLTGAVSGSINSGLVVALSVPVRAA
jgi:hypothetical protein